MRVMLDRVLKGVKIILEGITQILKILNKEIKIVEVTEDKTSPIVIIKEIMVKQIIPTNIIKMIGVDIAKMILLNLNIIIIILDRIMRIQDGKIKLIILKQQNQWHGEIRQINEFAV